MSNPENTTAQDICQRALRLAGAVGLGQTPAGGEMAEAIDYLQMMLQEWQRKRWLVYHLVNLSKVSTGALSYSIGPGGDIDTGEGSVRPIKIESAFVRQVVQSSPNQVDYPLGVLQSREDYDKIALKSLRSLRSFPGVVFLDTGWPLATLHVYPIPQANIYSIFISIMAPLPNYFPTAATEVNLPYEYYWGIVSNLAMRLRTKYQLSSYPGDTLPKMAKDGLATIRGSNTQIARLTTPNMTRGTLYNIYSDQSY